VTNCLPEAARDGCRLFASYVQTLTLFGPSHPTPCSALAFPARACSTVGLPFRHSACEWHISRFCTETPLTSALLSAVLTICPRMAACSERTPCKATDGSSYHPRIPSSPSCSNDCLARSGGRIGPSTCGAMPNKCGEHFASSSGNSLRVQQTAPRGRRADKPDTYTQRLAPSRRRRRPRNVSALVPRSPMDAHLG